MCFKSPQGRWNLIVRGWHAYKACPRCARTERACASVMQHYVYVTAVFMITAFSLTASHLPFCPPTWNIIWESMFGQWKQFIYQFKFCEWTRPALWLELVMRVWRVGLQLLSLAWLIDSPYTQLAMDLWGERRYVCQPLCCVWYAVHLTVQS